ncbi:PKD domain-containing protein [Vicingaceae bacterium]|nr:PKD domain-containing protein [Vicingaceae bacterium]
MKKLLVFTILLLALFNLKAQVIQLGTGTTETGIQTASPVNIYWRRQVSQFVYTAAEINTAGASGANTLSQLGFYVTANPIYAIPNYTIKIKHTAQNNVNNALGTTGWTTVKNAFSYSPDPGGYDMIIFDTPFNWDGTQNIAVEICWSQVQPNYNGSGQCRIYSTTNGYRYSLDDNTGSICGSTPGNVSTNKPQAQLVFKTSSTWNGSLSTDWFNDGNWDIGTPDSELDALIPSGVTNMPVISSAGAECNNLDINAGASMTIAGSNSIDIYQDWTNNGTFVANTGNVTLKGTSVNNINGANDQDLYDLTIDNINGANISSGSINIYGNLNIGIATGNFNTNNALTFISNASGTGRISELTTKCLYTLDMTDTYGDSWNGAFITVLIDGVQEGTYFAKGANSTSNFIAPEGATVQLNYTAGDFEFENSYILYDGSNTQIFTDGTSPDAGINVFNTTANCNFFNPITGNITMQRYINSGLTTWKYLSSAVSGTTIGDYSDDFFTTGFIGSNYPPSLAVPNPWVSIYTYNESIPGVIDSGFVKVTNTSNPISVGQGFWAWVDGSQTTTIDITGPPNVGNINTNLSYTNNSAPTGDGWNMVGNPYPSSIDWDAIPASDKTNINNAIYIWDGENQQYASYVFGIGANGGSKNIPSTQAFWVQANSPGPSIQFTEANKVAADAPFLKQSSSVAPLRIKTENTYGSDELVINFQTSATNNFDGEFDAKKLASSNTSLPNSSSVLNGVDYSINQINPQEISIPIKILTGITGTHIIRFENAYDFNPSSCLILEDLFSGISYNLSLVDSFSVTIYDTTQTSRFLLHIGAPTKVTSEDVSCFGNNNAKIVFSKNSSSPFNIIWRNSSNAIIANNSNVVVSDSISNLNPGEYYIETTDALCGNLIDTVFINEPLEIIAQFSTNIDTVYLSNGGIIDFTNQSTNALNYNWDFGDFNISTINSPSHQYTQAGIYNVTLNAYQNANCYKETEKEINVIGNIATSINTNEVNNSLRVWVSDKKLLINGNNLNKIEVKNALGQLLISKFPNRSNFTSVNLSQISSQVLIVTTYTNNNRSTSKVNYINQ